MSSSDAGGRNSDDQQHSPSSRDHSDPSGTPQDASWSPRKPVGDWYQPPDKPRPYNEPPTPATPRPIRAGEVLAASIIAFFCCGIIVGPLTAIEANRGIAAIDAGKGEPHDRQILIAARICAIFATALPILLLIARLILKLYPTVWWEMDEWLR